MPGLGTQILAGTELLLCQVALYETSKCFCVSGPKCMIRAQVYKVPRGVSAAARASLPKSTHLTDVRRMMQRSLILGQLDQMIL